MNARWLLLALALSAPARAAWAEPVPPAFSFSARLADHGGHPLSRTVELRMALFDGKTRGTLLWEEEPVSVDTDGDGVLAHEIGRQPDAPLPPELFTGRDLYLEVSVDGEVMEPRVPLLSVPYAFRAEVAGRAEALGELSAGEVALADHAHPELDDRYLRQGSVLACPAGERAVGLDVTGGQLSLMCQPGARFGDVFALDANGRLVIADGAIGARQLAPGAVGTAQLEAGSVQGDVIGEQAVGASQLQDASIREQHLAGGIPVYWQNAACTTDGQAGVLSMTATCNSALCCRDAACASLGYYTCTGFPAAVCNRSSAVPCTNQLVGALVAP